MNVSKLESAIIGTGGFIDISQKARKVVFCGTLAARGKLAKFVPAVRQITFSGHRAVTTGQQVLYVTDVAVFRLGEHGVVLEEIAPGLNPETDIFPRMAFRPEIASNLRTMPAELFRDEPLPPTLFPLFLSDPESGPPSHRA